MKSKKLLILTVACLLSAFLQTAVLAADYRIDGADWETDSNTGSYLACWLPYSEEKADKTRYVVKLYRENTNNMVGKAVTVDGTSYDFYKEIASSGTGNYLFQVYPVKGGADLLVESELIEVTSADVKVIKNRIKEDQARSEENFQNGVDDHGNPLPRGWIQNPDRTWYFRQMDGKLMKSMWAQIDGKTYFFSSTGIMLTGWNRIDRKWYCFDENGALYRNTITPDGCQVDADGAWIIDGIAVVDQNARKNRKVNEATVQVLSNYAISATETSMGPGRIKTLGIKNSKEAVVDSVTFSKPYEEWVPGEKIKVTVVLSAVSGCNFAGKVDYTCKKADVKSYSGTPVQQTVILEYVPKKILEVPSGIFISEDGVIRWNAVQSASRYDVRILDDATKETLFSNKQAVRTLDLSPYLDHPNVIFKVSALADKSKSAYLLNSDAFVIKDMDENYRDYCVDGSIKFQSDNRFSYTDSEGEKVRNCWKELAGYWYHFDRAGVTDGPGWFQDVDNRWYYFNKSCQMMVGDVYDGGKLYHLNDGSISTVPLGAWIE